MRKIFIILLILLIVLSVAISCDSSSSENTPLRDIIDSTEAGKQKEVQSASTPSDTSVLQKDDEYALKDKDLSQKISGEQNNQTGLIVFSSRQDKDANRQIFAMKPDDSRLSNISNSSFDESRPQLSPDGNKIVFRAGTGNGRNQIYTMDIDGSNRINLSNNEYDESDAAFSPDGSKILFKTSQSGNNQVYVMDIYGGSRINLSKNQYSESQPLWSPDGGDILFKSVSQGNSQLYIMKADGSKRNNISNNDYFETGARWSPDGKDILFESKKTGAYDQVYVMRSDGSGRSAISEANRYEFIPDWSPDGEKILFYSMDEKQKSLQIHITDNRGGDRKILSNNEMTTTLEKLQSHFLINYLGMDLDEIEKSYGIPEDTGYWSGSAYYSYIDSKSIVFFYDEFGYSGYPGKVWTLMYSGAQDILGARVGMTFTEIKEILGSPFAEEYSELDEDYILSYVFEDALNINIAGQRNYSIIFYFYAPTPEGKTSYLSIFAK
jgi:TolB protein